jgi:hypothetical protein
LIEPDGTGRRKRETARAPRRHENRWFLASLFPEHRRSNYRLLGRGEPDTKFVDDQGGRVIIVITIIASTRRKADLVRMWRHRAAVPTTAASARKSTQVDNQPGCAADRGDVDPPVREWIVTTQGRMICVWFGVEGLSESSGARRVSKKSPGLGRPRRVYRRAHGSRGHLAGRRSGPPPDDRGTNARGRPEVDPFCVLSGHSKHC